MSRPRQKNDRLDLELKRGAFCDHGRDELLDKRKMGRMFRVCDKGRFVLEIRHHAEVKIAFPKAQIGAVAIGRDRFDRLREQEEPVLEGLLRAAWRVLFEPKKRNMSNHRSEPSEIRRRTAGLAGILIRYPKMR